MDAKCVSHPTVKIIDFFFCKGRAGECLDLAIGNCVIRNT
jgi:hypothetical protein